MYNQANNNVSDPSYWEKKYQSGNTHWDLNGPTPAILEWIKKIDGIKKICIIGAGNGYDAIEIAKLEHDVYAVDFSHTAISNLIYSAKRENQCIIPLHYDLFLLPDRYPNYFDLVVEYTCFCAIDPSRRKEYRDVVYKILRQGGILMALLFPINKPMSDGGPPFGVDPSETIPLFEQKFATLSKITPRLSVKRRIGDELLVEFQKV